MDIFQDKLFLYCLAAFVIIVGSIVIYFIWDIADERHQKSMDDNNKQNQKKAVRLNDDTPGYLWRDTKSGLDHSKGYPEQSSNNSYSFSTPSKSQQRFIPDVPRKTTTPSVTPVQELTDEYNRAVQKKSSVEFKQKYRNRLRIGVKNTEERLKDPVIVPVFIDHDAGNYWGFNIEGSLYVVPRLELTFIETHHNPGGMNYVFKYRRFDILLKYTEITVIKPAIFTGTASGYNLLKQGEIDLGSGIER